MKISFISSKRFDNIFSKDFAFGFGTIKGFFLQLITTKTFEVKLSRINIGLLRTVVQNKI